MEVDDTQNPVSIGFTPAQGSITGFDQIIDDTITTILTKGWSKEQLHQAILNLREQVGTSGVQTLLKLLSAHLQDFNNPHKVTIAQVASDVIAQILSPILPGTPPSTPPIFALFPELTVPSDYLPVVYSGAQTSDQKFGFETPNYAGTYAEKPDGLLPTGLYGDIPIIPMITDVDTSSLSIAQTPLAGSAVTAATSPTGYTVLSADGSGPTTVGISEVITAPLNVPLTMTRFVIPDKNTTFITITRGPASITIDLNALTTLSTNPSTDVGDVERLPNGTIRITHCFTPTDTTPVVTAFSVSPTSTPATVFTNAQVAATISPAQLTNTIGSTPPLLDGEPTVSKSTLVGTFPDVIEKDLTLALTLASLPYAGKAETVILTLGGISISVTPMGYKIATTSGTAHFLSTEQNAAFVRMAVSLSATRLCIKFRGEAKFVATGDFTALLPTDTTFTLTDFQGGIRDIVLYAESDRDQLLEFLTDA